MPTDGGSEGAAIARQALERAREAVAASRLKVERSAAGRRRAATRAANDADARARVQSDSWGGADRDPKAFGASIEQLLADRGWTADAAVARVTSDWVAMVGPDLAAHCQPVSLRDQVLTIEAESTAWATQIRLLGRTLISRIADVVGPGVVAKLVVHGPAGPSWRHGRLRVRGAGPRDTYG